jgi:hypothetical protein
MLQPSGRRLVQKQRAGGVEVEDPGAKLCPSDMLA